MIQVPSEVEAIITKPGRTFAAKLTFGDAEYTRVATLLHSTSFTSNGAISVGEAVCASLEVQTVDDLSNAENEEFFAEYSVAGQSFPLGIFIAEKPVKNGCLWKFTAYDRMTKAEKTTYHSALTYPATTSQVFTEIVSQCGFSTVVPSVEYAITADVLSGYTCRQALAYLAGFLGCNCIVNKDGVFEMCSYTAADLTVYDRTMETPDVAEEPTTVQSLLCTVSENIMLTSGEGSKSIAFVCPLMTQERLDAILAQLKSAPIAAYTPATVRQLCGDPRIELGDVVTVSHFGTTYQVPVMALTRDFDGGLIVGFQSFDTAATTELSLAQKIDLTYRAMKKPSTYASAAAAFSELINSAIGFYTTVETLPSGAIKVYMHDKATLAESTYIATQTGDGFATANAWAGDNTIWTAGLDRDGNALVRALTTYKLTAEQIDTRSLIVSSDNLAQDVLDLIEAAGEDDGVLHGTATPNALTDYYYDIALREDVAELPEGTVIALTFPQGISVEDASSVAYMPTKCTFTGLQSVGQVTLRNANNTTAWVNTIYPADYATSFTKKFIVRSSTTSGESIALCACVDAEDVTAMTLVTADSSTPSGFFNIDPGASVLTPGTVWRLDASALPFGVIVNKTGTGANVSIMGPYIGYSATSTNYSVLLSKNSYARENFATDYLDSLEQVDGTAYKIAGLDEIYVIAERLRYLSGEDVRDSVALYELAYQPTEKSVNAVDQEARDAAAAASSATKTLMQKLIALCTDNNMTYINGGAIAANTVGANQIVANDALLANLLARTATITGLLRIVGDSYDTINESLTTEEKNAYRDDIAAELGYSSYASIPSGAIGSVYRLVCQVLSNFMATQNKALQESPLKLYTRDGSNLVLAGGLSPLGLVYYDADGNPATIYGADQSRIYGDMDVVGALTVGGREVNSKLTQKGIVAINAEAGDNGTATVNLSGFTNTPSIQVTVELVEGQMSSAWISSVSASSFTITTRPYASVLYTTNTSLKVHWTANEI